MTGRCLWCGGDRVKRTGSIRNLRGGHEDVWECRLCGRWFRLVWRRSKKEPVVKYWVWSDEHEVGSTVEVPAGCLFVGGDL